MSPEEIKSFKKQVNSLTGDIEPVLLEIKNQIRDSMFKSGMGEVLSQIEKTLEPFKQISVEMQKATKIITDAFAKYFYVNEDIYEFLIKVKAGIPPVDLTIGLSNGLYKEDELFYIWTRVENSSGVETPTICVTKETYLSIKQILKNYPQRFLVKTNKIEFDDEKPRLIINGRNIPLKRGDDRYLLCKYMFENTEIHETPWELDELVSDALGVTFNAEEEDWYQIIYGKYRALNKVISDIVGYDRFFVPQNTAFTINTPYIFLLRKK
ncbi:hypothetical protein M0R04_01330 [Candidatus Dojkabacteria bacterium]|jgi:hypothetical protein|nr:hypothetical protein [Candidatus Dojkabacteria bacterium]